MSHREPSPVNASKEALRDQLLAARREVSVAQIASRAKLVAEHLLDEAEVRRAATVAAYVSVGREPGTGPLLDALTDAGKRVVLPALQPDGDLDWALYRGPDSLAPARRGLLEPVGPLLGPATVATADVVLVPGLGVDGRGRRLGRGGGSYDRALARVPVGTFVCIVLNAAEVLDAVPTEAHDRPVSAVVTEDGVRRLTAG
ncbi:5-formyltetrahydrofolate cyclo-ligase [Nocardioides mangrovicus]|uniref:5-formyltetrahydrofolate cyclo-ligase n=1 Tax=Nocardioides mangrovicus TaxID=2478913 RepID=A0A3L8NWE9_9ACTN|nr:5-formyltetrahydrofolate cyclo-ligase [Nocardioides mangrovicus]RLV47475.1 5-formyltetrahydrofolate cyclo-ligase [Nocardioides mangrovicus]